MQFYTGLLILSAYLLIATFSLVGLAAMWAAMSGRHWFVRAVVLGLFLSVWLLAGEYMLLAFFFGECLAVIFIFRLIRFMRGEKISFKERLGLLRKSSRFSLLDMLLFMVVAAVLLAVFVSIPDDAGEPWQGCLILGSIFGVALTFRTQLLLSVQAIKKKWFYYLFSVFSLLNPLTTLTMLWSYFARKSGFVKVRSSLIQEIYWEEAANAIEEPKPGPLWAKAGLALVSVAIVAPSIFFYGWVISPKFTPLPGPPVPTNNGYLLLVEAAEKLAATKFDPTTATDPQLRTFLDEHEEILKLTRQGLALPCRVPHEDSLIYIQMPFSRTSIDSGAEVNDRKTSLRGIARLLTAEGSMLAREGRMDEAVDRYFETMQFGRAMSEGGIGIDYMIGHAYQGSGLESLRNDLDLLDDRQMEELIDRLAELERQPFPAQNVQQREQIYFDKANYLLLRFAAKVTNFFQTDYFREFYKRTPKLKQTKLRLLMTHLAIRRFRLAHDRLPEGLEELTAEFLTKPLEDPFSEKPLIYRTKEEGYQLYSVGPNGVDDGGTVAGPKQSVDKVGDIVLDPVAKAGAMSGAEVEVEEGDTKKE